MRNTILAHKTLFNVDARTCQVKSCQLVKLTIDRIEISDGLVCSKTPEKVEITIAWFVTSPDKNKLVSNFFKRNKKLDI